MALLAGGLVSWCALAGAETWRFAVIGDTPYTPRERAELPQMLERISDGRPDLIAHVGDIKSGRERCEDALFEDRRQLFDAVPVPFVFVPGDNEWADCERVSNGHFDPLERLEKLRSLFWRQPDSLGRKRLLLERQPGEYPEHSRFRLGPILFVTLNLPGDDNNHGLSPEPRGEFLQRNPIVLAWIKDSFAIARREGLAGIVLLFQGNPGFRHFSQGLPHRGFKDFLDLLRDETAAFRGQVVAVHGDTHISRIDQPLRDRAGKRLENFVRVESFGYPLMGWIEGVIDTESSVPIRFSTHPWPEPVR
jgi:hypothetical protein